MAPRKPLNPKLDKEVTSIQRLLTSRFACTRESNKVFGHIKPLFFLYNPTAVHEVSDKA